MRILMRVLFGLGLAVATASAWAANATWNGLGVDALWSTTTNWTVSPVPGAGDTATFSGAGNAQTTIDLGSGVTVGAILFDTANAAAYTIGSGAVGSQALTLSAGGSITMGATVAANETINASVVLGADATTQSYTFSNDSTTNSLILAGGVSGGTGGTAGAETLNVDGAGATTISGVISNGGATSLALTKRGKGTLTLSGAAANTYTGATTVNGGTLALNFANLGTPTDLINSGSALVFGGGAMTITGASSGVTSQTFAGTAVNAGGGSLLVNPNNGTSTTVNLGSLGTLSSWVAGSSLVVGKAVTANTGTVAVTTTTSRDATGIYGGRIVFANGTANTGYDWATSASASSPYTLSAYSGYAALAASGTDTNNSRITASATPAGNITTNSLKIENPAASQTLALGANTLVLTSGGLLSTGTNAFTISGTATTGLTGGNGSGAYDLIVHQYNIGGLTISAAIGNNAGNATNLTKTGPGTLTLTNTTNTFSGKIYVNGGTLSLGSSVTNALGTAPAGAIPDLLTLNGGTLDGQTSNNLNYDTNRGIFIGPGGGTLNNIGSWDGPVSGGGNLTFSNTNNMRFNGGGASNYTASYDNTWTGDAIFVGTASASPYRSTAFQFSTVDLSQATSGNPVQNLSGQTSPTFFGGLKGSGNLTLNFSGGSYFGNNSKSTTYTGVISGANPFIKIGAGTLTLTGASTYSGSTTVSNGTLLLDFGTSGSLTNIISTSSALTLGGGNLAIRGKGAATNTQGFASTTANAFSTLTLTGNSATSLDVTLGALTFTGGAGINFVGATGTAAGTRFITSSSAGANDGTTRLAGGSLWNGGGWASITASGGTNYVTAWSGTYTDVFTGTAGSLSAVIPNTSTAELRIQENGSDGSPNTLAAATTTINSLLINTATTASVIKMNAIGANDTLVVGNGASASGAIAVASGAQSLTIGQSAGQGFLTAGSSGASSLSFVTGNAAAAQGIVVNSVIANNAGTGAVSISAGGAGGTVTLNAVNTYTGTTAVANGTLVIGGAGQLGSGTYAGNITLGGGGILNYSSTLNQTLSGAISGNGNLVKNGNAILTVSGTNTYIGNVSINQGTFKAGSASAFGSATSSVTVGGTGATLDLNGLTIGLTVGNSTALGTGILTLNGTGILGNGNALGATTGGALMNTSATAAKYSGAVVLGSSSSIVASGGAITLSGPSITGSGSDLTLDGANGITIVGSINTGSGNVTKFGGGTSTLQSYNTFSGNTTIYGGTLTLTGNNTYTGATTINGSGSTLSISGATGAASASNGITFNGGTLTLTNTTTAEGAVNRIGNSAPLASNGGTLNYTNTATAGYIYAETIGAVTLAASQFNTVLTTNQNSGSGNIQTLTLAGLARPGSANTSSVTFSAGGTAPNATTNIIRITGATATPAGQIIGPWATVGTSATVQTDYAVYDAAGNIVAANIAGSLDSTWSDSTKAYTSAFLGGANANSLSAVTHNMAALRNLPAFGNAATATTIAIPTGGNLNTYGLLNANTSTWTINQVAGSTGALSTPAGGGSIYINTGNGTAAGNGAITIGAPINDNGGAVSIVKTGTGSSVAVGQGVLTLSNVTSSYSGATVINAGAIVLNTSGALADINVASSLGKGSAGGSAADLVINGGFLQYGTATTAVSTNRLFSIGTSGGTIDSSAGTTATMSFVGTGAMGFASQAGPRTLTLQGSNIGVAASTSGSNSSFSTVALLIGDSGGVTSLTKAGAGTWALFNPASTYTGPTTISGGILNVATLAGVNAASSIGQGSAAGSAADIVISGGTLQYSNSTAATTNRLFSIGTSGTLDSSAASPGNTLSFTATGPMGFNNSTAARTLTLTGTNTGANSLGLRLDDFTNATALTKSGTGTWVVANAGNTYTGITTINSGILSVGKLANGGVASSIGASTNAAANLVFNATNSGAQTTIAGLVNAIIPNTGSNAPILQYTGSGDSTDRLVNFTTGANASRFAVLDASGSGAINFTNAGSPTFANAAQKFTLVFGGTNTGNNTFAGVIPNNTTAGVSVVKTGPGTWILSGNNTYSDAAGTVSDFGTLVNQGTLVLSGSPTAATALKTTVNAGGTLRLDYTTNTSKLSDTGILTLAGGTLNLSGGSHTEVVTSTTFSAGASSVVQTNSGTSILRMNAITRNAGGMVDFGAAGIADTDTTNAAGVGILGAYATIAGANWAKSVDASAADTAITAYTAYTDIDALGSTIANAATTNVRLNTASGSNNIALGAATTAINTLLQNTATAATVDTTLGTLQTTGIMIGDGRESLTIGLSGGPGSLQAATAAGDLVLNNASNYSGTNPGKTLTINVPVILNGASTLTTAGNVTLNRVNTYTGATYVNSGTLTIAGTGSLNSGSYGGAITIAQGATLNYTSSANQTLSTATSGFGNLNWNPSSSTTTLTLSADRGATSAPLTITSGSVAVLATQLGGSGPASDLIFNGGTLRFLEPSSGNNYQTAKLFTLGTGGATIQPFTLDQANNTRRAEFTGTGALAFAGFGTRTLKFESGVALGARFAPAIGDGPGGATSVVMGGTAGANGIWTLEGANTYTGTTSVDGSSLVFRKQQAANNGVAYFTTSNISVASGASLAVGVGAAPTYFDASAFATILDSSHLGASTSTTGLKTGARFGMDTTASDFTYSAVLADLSGGNVLNFAKHGINTLTLSGNNTYTGTTTIYGDVGTSTLRAGSSTAFGQATTASIVFGYGNFNSIQKLQLFGNNVTLIGLNSPVSNWRDGKGESYIESGSSDTSGTGTDILTINTPVSTTSTWNNAQALNSGISRIQDGGARRLGITKGGAGTLELGGTNTYTGGTIINAGTLRALSTTGFGAATSATLSFGPGSTGIVQLNGNATTIVGLSTDPTSVGTPFVEAGATSATLTINPLAGTTSTFAGVLRNNGGSGGTLTLAMGGPGILTLSGNNTYTGNTTVSGGTLILSGNNVSAITGTTTVSGGVIQYNTLASINGTARNVTVTSPGAMVFGATLSDTDIATGLGRVVAASTGAIAADNNAAGAFDFSTAGLASASLGAVGNVTYTGTLTPNGGTYRLGGGGGTLTYPTLIAGSALTVSGGSNGSVVLSNAGNTLGALTVSSGVLDLNGTTGQTAAAVSFAGGTVQNGTITGSSYSGTGGTVTATLGGAVTFTNSSGTTTLNANNSGYSGPVSIAGGTLRAVNAASLGSNTVTINNTGTLALASDGTGTGLGNSRLESIGYGNAVALSGTAQTITVGQFTAGVGTLNAANKTLTLGSLGIGASTLTVTNNNGFGLEFTGTTTLTGAPTFSVGGGSNAPVVQGLTLSGVVSGDFGITKSGAGTLVLGNAGNTFGLASTITISGGLVSVAADAALGASTNIVSLNASGAGLQANGTFSTIRRINTTTASGVIDVTQGNVFTLNTTALNNGTASANAFQKNGNGIFEINVDNTANYTGAITVNAGAIRVSSVGALGAAANNTTVANNVGAAVQINNVSTAETFSINNSGINIGGAIENFSGTNDLTGLITLASAATIGSTSGTLNVKGGIAATTQALTYAGAGNITVSNTAITGTTATQTKIGSGTLEIKNANPLTGVITINAGTFKLTTAGTVAGTTTSVTPGATLTLDNTTAAGGYTTNRLGSGKALTLSGATFNYTGGEAADSVETTGVLTLNAGQTTITNNAPNAGFRSDVNFNATPVRNAGSTVLFRGTSLGSPAAAGVATIRDGTTGFTFIGQAGAAGATTKAILPWAILDTTAGGAGSSFATADTATSILRPLNSSTEMVTNTFTSNTNVLLNNAQVMGVAGGATTTINSLTMNNASSQVMTTAGAVLALDSGGLLGTVTNAGISGGYLATTSNRELLIHTLGDMTIGSVIGNSAFSFTAPLTKAGAGNLTLRALNNYGGATATNGTTTINQGTLTLDGGNNTLATNHPMIINKGGTLALGSNNQYISTLSSAGAVEGAGGNITGTGTLTVNQAAANTFAGNIGGSVSLTLTSSNASTLSFSSANDTSGSLNLLGGRVPDTDTTQAYAPGSGLTLIDGGTLLSVGNIRISQASLNIDNTGTKDLANRVRDTAAITLDGGAILFRGRGQSNSTETLGDVTAKSGRSFLTAVAGGTGVNSAQLTLNSLTRNTGASIGLNFGQGTSGLGQIGSNARIVVTGGLSGNLAPVNGVVPGVTNGQTAFVGYAPGLGFGQLGTAGFPANYSGALNAAAATDNVNGASATVVKAGGQTINSLVQGSITFVNATDVLTLASGMLNQGGGFPNAIGTQAVPGRLTSGLSSGELFYFKNGGGGGNGTLGNSPTTSSVINSVITDNGGTRVSLIVQGSDRTSFAGSDQPGMQPAVSAPNTYTGGTFVNGNGASAFGLASFNPGDVTIPAAFDPTKGLVITNAGVTMLTNAGQIAPSNIVTLNGNSLLTYVGNNTQAGIVFNSYGSSNTNSGTPTVTGFNILTLTGNISSTPANVAVVPTISGGTLDLNNTGHNITVDGGTTAASLFHAGSGAAVTGLTISSIINSTNPASGSITKLGTGVLELSGVNVFTGGLTVNAGAVKMSNAAAIGGTGNTVTLNNNAALWLNALPANQTIVVGATGGTIATLGDQSINDNITLNGPLTITLADPTLNNTDRTINYNSATSGTVAMSGPGSLVVSGNVNNPFNATPKFLFMQSNQVANTYTGGTTVNSGGRIKLGFASPTYLGAVGVSGSVGAFNGSLGSSSGTLTVNTGGVLDMNTFSQTIGNLDGTGGTITSTGTTVLTIGYGNNGGGNFAGVIATGATGSLVKVGTGTIALSGANTFGNGTNGTTVAGGTLTLDFTTATTAAPVLLGTAPLTLSGGTLNLQNGTNQVQTVASTTLTGGRSNVTRSSGTSILRMNAITPATGIVNFGADSIASTTNANDASGILGAWATVGGTDWAMNSGLLENSSSNAYVVGLYSWFYTDIDTRTSTIADNATSNVRLVGDGIAGNIALGSATTTISTLLQSNASYASTVDTAGKALLTNGIMIGTGNEALTIGATVGDGSLKTATAGANLALINYNSTKTLTLNAPVVVNSTSGLSTTGNVLLNGANTFTGGIGIGNGTLEIGGAGSLTAGTYSGAIQIGTGGTLKINTNVNHTLNGIISGEGGVVKDGSGTLTLGPQMNSYKGNTIVNAGTLDIGNRAVGDYGKVGGTLTINAGATAKVGDTLGYQSPATVLSVVNINGGTFDRTAAGNSTTGGLTINMTGGTLSHSGTGYWQMWGNQNGFGQCSINTLASPNASLISGRMDMSVYDVQFSVADGSAAVDLEVSAHLGGSKGLVKSGAGLMALTYNNTDNSDGFSSTGYTGATTISAGTLQLGNGGLTGTIGPSSAIVNNGTLAFNRTNALVQGTDFNSVISGTGGVSQLGSGITVLNGLNTYAGVTRINAGTLSVSADANLGGAAGGLTFGGGTLKASGSFTSPRSVNIGTGGGTFTQNIAADALTLSGALTGSGRLTQAGPGTLVISTPASSSNGFSGITTISGGTLSLVDPSNNNIPSSTFIDVQQGATLNTTGLSGSGANLILTGQGIGGRGSIVGNLTIGTGATLSPGSSPGILSQTGSQTWATGGNYNWQVYDASGVAGSGFDQMSITGTLTIQSGFNVNLWSLAGVGPDVNGDAINFSSGQDSFWVIATASGGLVNVGNLALANIYVSANNGTSGFTNTLSGRSFSLAQGGQNGVPGTLNDVVLTYTSMIIPEPDTLALAGVGAVLAAWAARRARRRA